MMMRPWTWAANSRSTPQPKVAAFMLGASLLVIVLSVLWARWLG